MTQISPGITSITPISVRKRTPPCCGTIEHLAVGVEEVVVDHGPRREHRRARPCRPGVDVAGRCHGAHALDEIRPHPGIGVGSQRSWPIGSSCSTSGRRRLP
jgi:hypothetical protein